MGVCCFWTCWWVCGFWTCWWLARPFVELSWSGEGILSAICWAAVVFQNCVLLFTGQLRRLKYSLREAGDEFVKSSCRSLSLSYQYIYINLFPYPGSYINISKIFYHSDHLNVHFNIWNNIYNLVRILTLNIKNITKMYIPWLYQNGK